MCAFKLRDPQLRTVSDIVQSNTGMKQEDLLSDERFYEICHLHDAAELIRTYLDSRKMISIFADYDVDGITSAAILSNALTYRGKRHQVRLPKRFTEGYGASPAAIDEFKDGGLLILVDNGIVSFDAVKRAKEKKMQVIIIDHHLPMEDENGVYVLPEADIIVNPHVFPGDFNDYCGAGLCCRLICELFHDIGYLTLNATILAAIGTICDSVPLVYENRRIVRLGLQYMENCDYAVPYGLRELIKVLELSGNINAGSVAFRIGPCLNAPGRLYDDGANKAFELLSSARSTRAELHSLALSISDDNRLRKELTEEWLSKLLMQIKTSGREDCYPIVEYIPAVPEGIIGILSGKISEQFQSPCFIFTDSEDPGLIKGSGRSHGDVNLKKLLDSHSDMIEKYGGHASAAGITIKSGKLDCLRESLSQDLGVKPVRTEHTIYDLEIRPEGLSYVVSELEKYSPYGVGNPEPRFLMRGLPVIPTGRDYYKDLASNGLKIITPSLSAITFSCREKYLRLGIPQKVDLVGTISKNTFRHNCYIQMDFIDVEVPSSNPSLSDLQRRLQSLSCSRYEQEAI